MNSLKIIRIALIIAVLSIVTGCSDQITSSGDRESFNKDKGTDAQSIERGLPVIPTYKFQIILKGHSKFDLDKLSTGLDKLYSIDITKTSADGDKLISDCNEILIYNIYADMFLDCHSHGFDFSSLTIENTGSSYKTLDILVRGIKFVKQQVINTKE